MKNPAGGKKTVRLPLPWHALSDRGPKLIEAGVRVSDRGPKLKERKLAPMRDAGKHTNFEEGTPTTQPLARQAASSHAREHRGITQSSRAHLTSGLVSRRASTVPARRVS